MKKNIVPFGMLFTQIMRNARVNVFGMEASAGVTQLKGVTCVKIAIADKFVEYAQKRKEEDDIVVVLRRGGGSCCTRRTSGIKASLDF